MQGRIRDTDVENRIWTPRWESGGWVGGGVMNWEIGVDIYILYVYKIDN